MASQHTVIVGGSSGIGLATAKHLLAAGGKVTITGRDQARLDAAQQSLGNVFSGLVLLFSHPFDVGDAVSFRSGAFSGQIEGIVTEIGISYVRLETADGVIRLPNSQVLASAVGPAGNTGNAEQAAEAAQEPAGADQEPAATGNTPQGPPLAG